jgi:hypothetical protein
VPPRSRRRCSPPTSSASIHRTITTDCKVWVRCRRWATPSSVACGAEQPPKFRLGSLFATFPSRRSRRKAR